MPAEPTTKSVSVEGVGRVSNAMASLAPSVAGTGASIPPTKSTTRPGRPGAVGSTSRAQVIDGPRLVVQGDEVSIQATIRTPKVDVPTTVTASPNVVISGGTEGPGDAPLQTSSPRVVSWTSKSSGQVTHGATVDLLPQGDVEEWTVKIAHIPGVVMRMKVEMEPLHG